MIVFGRLTPKQTKALNFFADALLSKQMQKHIQLRFSFRKSIKDYQGMVYVDDFNLQKKLRQFVVVINKNDTEEQQLITMAHELVHVKQFAYGEMDIGLTRWRGKPVKEDVPYLDQPWEVEADNLSLKLVEEFNYIMEKQNGNSCLS